MEYLGTVVNLSKSLKPKQMESTNKTKTKSSKLIELRAQGREELKHFDKLKKTKNTWCIGFMGVHRQHCIEKGGAVVSDCHGVN